MTVLRQQRDVSRAMNLPVVVGATSLVAMLGIGLAAAAYLRRYVLHDLPMTAALSGELRDFYCSAGRMAYYFSDRPRRSGTMPVRRTTHPLLFVHSVNAAASSYEVKPLYEHYARERAVYSLDLPGFGFSERTNREYTPHLYRDAINEFIAKELKGGPVDVVSLSLSSEFVALAANAKPDYFRTLTFIAPTGMSYSDPQIKPNPGLLSFLLKPSWSRLIFDLITSRPSIRYFTNLTLSKTYARGFAHYAYVSSHQPDAQYAPFYFVSGMLFTRRIFDVYASLKQPCLVAYGQSATTRLQRLGELKAQRNWQIEQFESSRDLVQFDDKANLILALDQHFARAD